MWSTVKDVSKAANEAGVGQAKIAAGISGSVSLVRNLVACIKGDRTPEEAALEVVEDTGRGAAVSYISAFSGTVIKGAMQNASSGYVRSLSKTNLATALVTTTADVGKTLHQYFKGDITGAECVEELGQQGVGEIGSAMFSAMGASLAATAAAGVGKTVKAGMDNSRAKGINESANDQMESSSKRLDEARKQCGSALEHMGKDYGFKYQC